MPTDTATPAVTHLLPFGARVTTCCGQPARGLDRWSLAITPDAVTCGRDVWTMTPAQLDAIPTPF